MKEFLQFLARQLVENPNEVDVLHVGLLRQELRLAAPFSGCQIDDGSFLTPVPGDPRGMRLKRSRGAACTRTRYWRQLPPAGWRRWRLAGASKPSNAQCAPLMRCE